MPCGLGQHPYFDCGPQTRIDTHVDCAWTIDANVLPVAKVAPEGRYDLQESAAFAARISTTASAAGAARRE